ncbi:MAG: nickel-responsive transcriptional regulator NikR [Gallionella sp.]
MERFTISLDEKLAGEFDRLIRERGYLNRSEAVRDMLRGKLDSLRLQEQQAPFCVASLSYVYNHHERDLAERLTKLQHGQHDLVVASTHVHLDHENCLETVMLRGKTGVVRRFADRLIAERGVRHGHINLVPVTADAGHPHMHNHPET